MIYARHVRIRKLFGSRTRKLSVIRDENWSKCFGTVCVKKVTTASAKSVKVA